MEEALKWLSEHAPVVFLVALLLLAAITITWRASRWIHRIKNTELECVKIEGQIIPKLDSVQRSVDGILIYLKNKDKTMDTSLFQSKSPFQLTPLGNKILSDSGGKEFVDKNIDYLTKEIEKQVIKSPLVCRKPCIVCNNDCIYIRFVHSC